MNKHDTVAVVMGGPSSEAAISRVTGTAIADALEEKGYQVARIELDPMNLRSQLEACGAKVVFNAVHGMYGEDGRLQCLLEAMHMPYTGSRMLASAVAMDKVATKKFLVAEKISTADYLIFNKKSGLNLQEMKDEICKVLGAQAVIKASDQGSSIGVVIAKEESEIIPALEEAFKFSENVLVEKCIKGRELTVSLMEENGMPKALPVIMIAPHSGSYDFHSKYTKGATDYLVPAPLSEAVTKHVQELAVKTYQTLGLSGVARVDVMLDEADQGYVLEANTVPGMTPTSLVPKAAAAVGISFPDLCEKILVSAR